MMSSDFSRKLHNSLRQIAGGSSRALEDFYRATCDAAYTLSLEMLRDPQAAGQAMQECYLDLWMRPYCPQKMHPLHWFLGNVHQHCLEMGAKGSPVPALHMSGGLTLRKIAKLTGQPLSKIRKEIRESKNKPFAAAKAPDLYTSIFMSAMFSTQHPPAQAQAQPVAQSKWLFAAIPVLCLAILGTAALIRHTQRPVENFPYLEGTVGIDPPDSNVEEPPEPVSTEPTEPVDQEALAISAALDAADLTESEVAFLLTSSYTHTDGEFYQIVFFSDEGATKHTYTVRTDPVSVVTSSKAKYGPLAVENAISYREAVDIALKKTIFKKDQITNIELGTSKSGSHYYYYITIHTANSSQYFYIHAVTGYASIREEELLSPEHAEHIALQQFPALINSPQELTVTFITNTLEPYHRVEFYDADYMYRVDIDAISMDVKNVRQRPLLGQDKALAICNADMGVSSDGNVKQIGSSYYLLEFQIENLLYLYKVSRYTGVILYKNVCDYVDSPVIEPSPPGTPLTDNEVLEIALRDAFLRLDEVSSLTVTPHTDLLEIRFQHNGLEYCYRIANAGENAGTILLFSSSAIE